MYLRRGVIPAVATSPAYTFGAPAVFCEGNCSGPDGCPMPDGKVRSPAVTSPRHVILNAGDVVCDSFDTWGHMLGPEGCPCLRQGVCVNPFILSSHLASKPISC